MAYGSALVDTIQSSTAGTAPQFNDGNGTQVGTLCRAWVNYNGVTTTTIRGSFNVSSITRSSAGIYVINLTNAMPDANYSANVTSNGFLTASRGVYIAALNGTQTSTTLGVTCWDNGGNPLDNYTICVSIFR